MLTCKLKNYFKSRKPCKRVCKSNLLSSVIYPTLFSFIHPSIHKLNSYTFVSICIKRKKDQYILFLYNEVLQTHKDVNIVIAFLGAYFYYFNTHPLQQLPYTVDQVLDYYYNMLLQSKNQEVKNFLPFFDIVKSNPDRWNIVCEWVWETADHPLATCKKRVDLKVQGKSIRKPSVVPLYCKLKYIQENCLGIYTYFLN